MEGRERELFKVLEICGWQTVRLTSLVRQCHWGKWISTSRQGGHRRLSLLAGRPADRTVAWFHNAGWGAQKVFFMKDHHFQNFQNSWMWSNSYIWQLACRAVFVFFHVWINELMNKMLAVVKKMQTEDEGLIRIKSKTRSKNRNQKGKEVRNRVGGRG